LPGKKPWTPNSVNTFYTVTVRNFKKAQATPLIIIFIRQSEHIGQWATPHHRRLGGIIRVVPIDLSG